MISKELEKKLDYYEQIYYALDEPVPFKGGLMIHPVTVKNYYNFHSVLPCITMDKTVKEIPDPDFPGKTKKVSNPEGIGQSYLEYLINKMKDEETGRFTTSQLIELLSLVFKIDKGLYCPTCHNEVTYDKAFGEIDSYVDEKVSEAKAMFSNSVQASVEAGNITEEEAKSMSIPKELLEKIKLNARYEYTVKALKCPECGGDMRDIFSIKDNAPILVIRDIEILPGDFDEFKAIVPRQNIVDYDDDKYIDPDLKEELELKSKLQNQDYTSPTLEKQLVCVGVATGYTLEYLHSITLRKLTLMLRAVDRERTYYAQLQASMSGMVKFKEDPKHWIFSDDKKNIAKELSNADDFTRKFDRVT